MRGNSTLVWQHGNNSAWRGNVEVAFIVADCLVLVVTFVVGIAANLFVAYAVWHQKSLQTSNNALLVNLAIVDFMRCATDCPLLLVVVVSGGRPGDLGTHFCDAQIVLFSLSCCVQLFTLASISAERYQAIAHPFKSAKRRRRVMAWIPLTWALPMVISVLCVLFAKDSPVYVRCRGLQLEELQTYDSFGLYVLFPVWCTCLAAILGFYTQIFILVRAHSRKIFDKGVSVTSKKKDDESKKEKEESPKEAKNTIVSEPAMAPKTDSVPVTSEVKAKEQLPIIMPTVMDSQLTNDTKSLETNRTEDILHQPIMENVTFVSELPQNPLDHQLTLQNLTVVSEMTDNPHDHQSTPQDVTFVSELPQNPLDQQSTPQDVTFVSELPQNPSDQQSTPQDVSVVSELTNNPPDLIPTDGFEDPNAPKPTDIPSAPAEPQTENTTQQNADMGAVCMMPSFANRDRGNKKKEGKLAKRSGYIILTFLIFWMPLMGTVLVNIFLKRDQNPRVQIVQELEVLAVSVACMTSFTNPIIYAAVNPQFRNEFYNLKARCKTLCSKT